MKINYAIEHPHTTTHKKILVNMHFKFPCLCINYRIINYNYVITNNTKYTLLFLVSR